MAAHVSLRPMLAMDASALAAIFMTSIVELTGDDYDALQQAAWSAGAEDVDAFSRRLAGWLTLVATINGVPVGFASLKQPDTIETLYVHPTAVGQGVATVLCDALERLAKARGAATVSVQASDTAQGFFAKRGFTAEQRNTVTLGDQWLGRTLMKKTLGAPAAGTVH